MPPCWTAGQGRLCWDLAHAELKGLIGRVLEQIPAAAAGIDLQAEYETARSMFDAKGAGD